MCDRVSFDSMAPFHLAKPNLREVVVVGGEEGEVALKACEVVCPEGLERANLEDVACAGVIPLQHVSPETRLTLDREARNDARAVVSAAVSRADESGTRRPSSDSSICARGAVGGSEPDLSFATVGATRAP